MYLIAINVPFRARNRGSAEVAGDWARSLILLRNSFEGRFGEVVVAAPSLPEGEGPIGEQVPSVLKSAEDGVRFVSLGDTRWRARTYWFNARRIRAKCLDVARRADVVHAGIGNLYQPYSLFGFNSGLQAGRTTVFVQDGDVVQRLQDLSRDAPFTVRAKNWGYSRLFACSVRRAVARADLALLKGKAVHDRYGQSARNAKDFHDTSYGLKDVIPSSAVDAKCAALARSGRLKCLVLGRLVDIKCVDHAIRAVSLATRSGARLELDIIGDGPDESRLRALACQLGVESTVRFLGSRQYGPDLLRTVAEYHVMLFTALAEETPRALFDGLAGGCALLAYESTYTRQVIGEIGHGRCVAKGDERALASLLRNVDVDRAQPEAWIRRAAAAAFYHAAESWYRRRAEWTIEAHLRRTGGR